MKYTIFFIIILTLCCACEQDIQSANIQTNDNVQNNDGSDQSLQDLSMTHHDMSPDHQEYDMTTTTDASPPTPIEVADPEGVMPGDVSVLALKEVRSVDVSVFVTSPACAQCHSNHRSANAMRDSQRKEIAPFNLWQGSMMANAGRDPFWWAQVASEIALNDPAQQEEIEGMCIRCHAPLLSESVRKMTTRDAQMRDFKANNVPSVLGVDGVACTGCHQIQASNLGRTESFSGGFEIGDERKIFGPHRNPATAPMQNHVNYTPTQADHVTTSALCATCHTLLHEVSQPDEDTVKIFPEQTPYLEWKNSIYSDENPENELTARTCQSCHQPTFDDEGVEIETRIARSPPGGDFRIDQRKPFGMHTFVGANTMIPQILKRERSTLNPQASDEAFDMITRLATEQIKNSVALEIRDVIQNEDGLDFTVMLQTHSGHKLPTGFPSRRAWLWVEVLDENDEILFRSGGFNEQGRILDQNGRLLDHEKVAGDVEPHHQVITNHRQVQIYQAVMKDQDHRPTHALTKAQGWLKDNRILPQGYRRDHPEAVYTLPVAVNEDDDFVGGQDQVHYQLAATQAKKIVVRMVYQSLGSKFIRLLFQSDVPEVAAFRTMYERSDLNPVILREIEYDL